jgi:hypothetical protein
MWEQSLLVVLAAMAQSITLQSRSGVGWQATLLLETGEFLSIKLCSKISDL